MRLAFPFHGDNTYQPKTAFHSQNENESHVRKRNFIAGPFISVARPRCNLRQRLLLQKLQIGMADFSNSHIICLSK